MSKHRKIIPVKHRTCEEVMIFLHKKEKKAHCSVFIHAWHESGAHKELQFGEVVFPGGLYSPDSLLLQEQYIADFSDKTAQDFVNRFTMKIEHQ